MTIAVQGCCHGELDRIYERLKRYEQETQQTVDLLLCCGDFQSLRSPADYHSFAAPPHHRRMGTFYRYYSGEKVAPVLTVFVGGNHESSQSLQELHYGGWVAPRIYYMGAAGVVRIGGIRIGGISGIYKPHDYDRGRHDEQPPYDRGSLRSVYHVRRIDTERLKSLAANNHSTATPPMDIMLSHDWPLGIEQHGDTEGLLRRKKHFRDEVRRNELGSPPNRQVLDRLKPKYWFSAHLHVKFKATLYHNNNNHNNDSRDTPSKEIDRSLIPSQVQTPTTRKTDDPTTTTTITTTTTTTTTTKDLSSSEQSTAVPSDEGQGGGVTQFHGLEPSVGCSVGPDLTEQMTRFLSLDKCLPGRHYLSILHMPCKDENDDDKTALCYDAEWLAVLKKTHHWTATGSRHPLEPATPDEIAWVTNRLGSLEIPENFCRTIAPYDPAQGNRLPPPLPWMGNPQTDRILSLLEMEHVITVPYEPIPAMAKPPPGERAVDENEIDLEEEEEEEEAKGEKALSTAEPLGKDENELSIDEDDDDDNDDDNNNNSNNKRSDERDVGAVDLKDGRDGSDGLHSKRMRVD